jgi:hypothetical protein
MKTYKTKDLIENPSEIMWINSAPHGVEYQL